MNRKPLIQQIIVTFCLHDDDDALALINHFSAKNQQQTKMKEKNEKKKPRNDRIWNMHIYVVYTNIWETDKHDRDRMSAHDV